MSNRRGVLIVLSGPSGAGKSTVISELLKNNVRLYFSISATTRAPRAHERHGSEYFFLEKAEFESMIKHDELLEYAEYVGNYYGTPSKPVEEKLAKGIDVLLDIEVKGAAMIKKSMPEAVLVFVVPPSLEELRRRLLTRGTESDEKIERRLDTAKNELKRIGEYDYLIINDNLDNTVFELSSIITAEKCKVSRRISEGSEELFYIRQ